MSLLKTAQEYRLGENWKDNFQYINYPNVEVAVKKILTVKEPKQLFDKHGILTYTDKSRLVKLGTDEQVFRIAVLIESQVREALSNLHGSGNIQATMPSEDNKEEL